MSSPQSNDLAVFAFVSEAKDGLSAFEIGQIFRQAWANNLALGISGILMFTDGRFQEVIEGPAEVIQRLAARIIADTRHNGITVTRFESVRQRMFSNWRIIGSDPSLQGLPSDAVVRPDDLDTVVPVFFGQSRSA